MKATHTSEPPKQDQSPPSAQNIEILKSANLDLAPLTAEDRVAWALEKFGDRLVLSSSFGIQSAVMLHLTTRLAPGIPVILIDTGHLFPETYRFIDELTNRLNLNLKVYRPLHSPAWQEARHGKLWEQGIEGIERYNQINKVEPMQRALNELSAAAWLAGLRREQSTSRQKLNAANLQNGRLKIHPIIDWNNKRVHEYLKIHDLPYHPLWEQGYVSVGDVQTTRKWSEGMSEEETRFFGLKRECGLHEGVTGDFSI
ncbi:MAG: phosphoadenylyl-sulfate reductase [Methylacidiphilales bacterium]|nr:phosphoadenylyl-sulfate reductase [Candidatus Methylacidiphilales bacterium]